MKVQGRLELNLPQSYDEKRPGFIWSHEYIDESIRDHNLAKRLPDTAQQVRCPTLYESASVFESLTARPDQPKVLAQYLNTDHPALSVHINSFTDATLASLSWNHAFMDIMGLQSFLRAWQAVLDGREEDVPAFIPYKEDPLVDLTVGADYREHVLYNFSLTGFWFILFVIRFAYEMIVHSNESGRMVRFPRLWVDQLRDDAIRERRRKGMSDKDAFLSHGDVLLAFWCKTTLAAQHIHPARPVHILNAVNVRGKMEGTRDPATGAFISNAMLVSITLTTAGEIDRMSVSELAGRIRADLQIQRDLTQVKSSFAWEVEKLDNGTLTGPPGHWNQLVFSWSNWDCAKFYDVDFSSANRSVDSPTPERMVHMGRPSLVMNSVHLDSISFRNGGPLIGQDARGDWWLDWVMRAEAWTNVEKILCDSTAG